MKQYLEKSKECAEKKLIYRLEIVPELLTAAVASIPAAFINATEGGQFQELLSVGAVSLPSFPARVACMNLLTYLPVIIYTSSLTVFLIRSLHLVYLILLEQLFMMWVM